MVEDQELWKRAKERAEEKAGFFVHLAAYVAVNAFLALLWWVTAGPGTFPWFLIPLGAGESESPSMESLPSLVRATSSGQLGASTRGCVAASLNCQHPRASFPCDNEHDSFGIAGGPIGDLIRPRAQLTPRR